MEPNWPKASYVAKDGLEALILPPPPLACWDHHHVSPHLVWQLLEAKTLSGMLQLFDSTCFPSLRWKHLTQGSVHSPTHKEHENTAGCLDCLSTWSALCMECKGKYSLANYMVRIAAKGSADIISQSSTKSEDRWLFTVFSVLGEMRRPRASAAPQQGTFREGSSEEENRIDSAQGSAPRHSARHSAALFITKQT